MNNHPDDEDFIKKANDDPKWPEDLDKPYDWRKASWGDKFWFKFGGFIKAVVSMTVITAIATSCIIALESPESALDEPTCTQSPQGCYE